MSVNIYRDANRVPEPVIIVDVMSTYRGRWALCGGWAVDAWLGRQTREHGDVDIAVFQEDLDELFDHLRGWQLIAHDPNVPGDTSEPWNGRHLDLPAHIHGRLASPSESLPESLQSPAMQGFALDIQIDQRVGGQWIFSREPYVSAPLADCIRLSLWTVPTLAPVVLLFYKAGGNAPNSEADFRALLPKLAPDERCWLRDALALVHQDHHWLGKLML